MLDLLHHTVHLMAAANLGNTNVGTANGMTTVGTDISNATADFRDVVGPLGVMGMIAGGAMHTLHFFSPQMQQRGMDVVKYSAVGVGLAIIGPLLVTALTKI